MEKNVQIAFFLTMYRYHSRKQEEEQEPQIMKKILKIYAPHKRRNPYGSIDKP